MVRPMGPLLPLLQCVNCWRGVDLVQLLKKIYEHAVELGQYILTFIDKRLWECTIRIMKYGPLIFTVVPHKDRLLSHYLEIGFLPAKFVFYYFVVPFLGMTSSLVTTRISKCFDI